MDSVTAAMFLVYWTSITLGGLVEDGTIQLDPCGAVG